MYVIRPVREDDFEGLNELAQSAAPGILSLPKNQGFLRQKILHSLESFAKDVTTPEKEFYLFVLEDTETGKVYGTSGIHSKCGVIEPLYFYQIETLNQESSYVPVPENIQILNPICLKNGPTELCALFLSRDLRQGGLGILLSMSRLLFIASHPHRFESTILARLRGYVKKNDVSPFWENVGHHFLKLNYLEVMKQLEKGNEFIPDILPKHPIYLPLLHKNTQRIISRVHVSTRPAIKMLKKEGFVVTSQVDIFDGGPVVAAPTKEIKAIAKSRVYPVKGFHRYPQGANQRIIGTTNLDFRCCLGTLTKSSDNKLIVHEPVGKALNIKPGDEIRYTFGHRRVF